MEYAILRIAKRTTASSVAGMARHALRETAVPNAEAGAPRPVVLTGEPNTPAVMARLRAALDAAPKRRADMVRALDILVTASPSAMQRMSKAEQDSYFKKALRFIAERFGGAENILTAAVHRDETTPHMQVLVMPRDRATGAFQASKMVGGRGDMSRMQDAFWEACGKPYGLDRGERRTGARHVTIREFYGAMEQGAEAPRMVAVPAAPAPLGLIARLSSTKRAAHAAAEAARAKALEHNKRERELIKSQAQVGRKVHPTQVAKLSQRYRAAQRLAALGDKARQEGQEALLEARRHHQAGVQAEAQAEALHKAAGSIFERQDGARLVATFTRTMAPEMVARLAKVNEVELVAGRDLIDQLRRAGKCKTLLDGARLLCSQVEGIEAAALAHHRAQQQGQRRRDEPERPRPRGG